MSSTQRPPILGTPPPPPPCVRVLTFDGGSGQRGLSSLLMLRDIMGRVAVQRKKTTVVRPSDCFDLIVGSGIGGILALLLGRMRMTVDDAIEEYVKMVETSFKPSASLYSKLRAQHAILDGSGLDCSIGEIAKEHLHDEDALFHDSFTETDNFQCRTAVLAATKHSANAPPVIFRSYSTTHPLSPFTIRQVARAATATVSVFSPAKFGNPPVEYIDAGSAGYNNPALIALDEVVNLWHGEKIDCMVSLGTGRQKIVSFQEPWSGIAEAYNSLLHDCERVHTEVMIRAHSEVWPYFRFNVDRDLEDGLDVELQQRLTGITGAYLRQYDVVRHLDSCVHILIEENSDLVDTPAENITEGSLADFLAINTTMKNGVENAELPNVNDDPDSVESMFHRFAATKRWLTPSQQQELNDVIYRGLSVSESRHLILFDVLIGLRSAVGDLPVCSNMRHIRSLVEFLEIHGLNGPIKELENEVRRKEIPGLMDEARASKNCWDVLCTSLLFSPFKSPKHENFMDEINARFSLNEATVLSAFSLALTDITRAGLEVLPVDDIDEHLELDGDEVKIYTLDGDRTTLLVHYSHNVVARALSVSSLGDEILTSMARLLRRDTSFKEAETLGIIKFHSEADRQWNIPVALKTCPKVAPKVLAARVSALESLVRSKTGSKS